jgi:two-component system, LytTR family, sensor kinase
MFSTSLGGRTRGWLWIIAIWTSLGVFDATQNVFSMKAAGMQHNWVNLFIVKTLVWLPWVFATAAVISLGRRFPVNLKSWSTWPIHLGAAAAIALIVAAWSTLLDIWLKPYEPSYAPEPFMVDWPLKIYGQLLPSLILYAFILAIIYMLDSRQRLATQQTETARLNEQLSKAQLHALRRQIEPHFLFNALNGIAGQVRERQNDAAVNMIVALSDFLRRVVKDFNDPQVRLDQEMEFVGRYLEIQKARFAGRLNVSIDVPDELLSAQVPSLILQPLVENAIKHGIAKRVHGGALKVAASACDGNLALSVYNDGPPLDTDIDHLDTGIGLSNLRTRLKVLYGTDFALTLKDHDATGVEVSVRLPLKEAS